MKNKGEKQQRKGAQKAKDEWGCKWFITHNAPTLTLLICDVRLEEIGVKVLAYKISFEVGEKGNLHKHMFCVLERSVRRSTLINKWKAYGAQIDKVTPGTEATVIQYVGDVEKEALKGCKVLTEYTQQQGDLDTTQGQRNDLSATDNVLWQIKDAIDAGETIRAVWNSFFPYMVRYGVGITSYHSQFRSLNKTQKSSEENPAAKIETPEGQYIIIDVDTPATPIEGFDASKIYHLRD